jgi:hypothetical protein
VIAVTDDTFITSLEQLVAEAVAAATFRHAVDALAWQVESAPGLANGQPFQALASAWQAMVVAYWPTTIARTAYAGDADIHCAGDDQCGPPGMVGYLVCVRTSAKPIAHSLAD